MSSKLWLDIETFSPEPITNGVHRYAEGAEVMIRALALDDGAVQVRDLTPGGQYWTLVGDDIEPSKCGLTDDLNAALDGNGEVWAHNSHFDRTVERHAGLQIPLHRWRDTMVQALAHSLPGSLGALCEVLKVDTDKAKDKAGKALINLFCKPIPFRFRKRDPLLESAANYKAEKDAAEAAWPGRATRETHPAEWRQFLIYAGRDILAMRECHKRMPKWNYPANESELALWHLDQTINDRGVAIDLELAEAAVAAVDDAQGELRARTSEITNGEMESATKRDAMLLHVLAEYGVDLPDLQMATLERRIADPDLPDGLRELLRIRLQASTTSTSKYKTLMRGTSADSRLRGLLQFCGAARTGRWAGRLWQPQNLPRPALKQAEIDLGIDALKDGTAPLLFDNVMELTSSAIRGCIVAPPGRKLVVADLSNIEGRVLAWLAGERWKIKAFADFDTVLGEDGKYYTGAQFFALCMQHAVPELQRDAKGDPIRKGHDLYKLSYGKSFGVAPEDVTKDQRQVGKVQELACLGPETLVLTDKLGYIRILDLTTELRVWDGSQWVRHQGLISRGERETLNMAGLAVTPDHLILTGTTWLPAQQLALRESSLCLALATGSENLSSSVRLSAPTASPARELPFSAPVVPIRTWLPFPICGSESQRGVQNAQLKKLAIGAKTFGLTPTSSPPTITGGAYSIAFLRASTAAAILTTKATQTMEAGVSKFTALGSKTVERILHTWSPLKAGTKLIWSWIESTSTKGTSPAIFVSFRTKSTREIAARSGPCRTPLNGLNKKMPVYDLLCAGPRNRFTVLTERGPLIVHNCGYEGGVGAYTTFASAYGIDLEVMAENAYRAVPGNVMAQAKIMLDWHRKKKGKDPAAAFGMSERAWLVCESFVLGWRDAHPAIVQFWKDIDSAVRAAIEQPGKTFLCRMCKVRRDGNWLRIGLPSGRALCYPSPEIVDGKITYMGVNQYSRKWARLDTYGGKLAENITQAVARDVMANGMPEVERQRYEIVLSVHDELITEAPDEDEFNADHLSSLLAANPPWAEDMPLAAAGFEAYRYKKD